MCSCSPSETSRKWDFSIRELRYRRLFPGCKERKTPIWVANSEFNMASYGLEVSCGDKKLTNASFWRNSHARAEPESVASWFLPPFLLLPFPIRISFEAKHTLTTFLLMCIAGRVRLLISYSMDDDQTLVETSSSRVFGIGAGLFTIIFFACFCLLLCYVGVHTKYPGFWAFPCPFSLQSFRFLNRFLRLIKTISFLIFLVITSILVLAPKRDRYEQISQTINKYDRTFVPRIVLAVILAVSALSAFILVLDHKYFRVKRTRYIEDMSRV